MRLTWWLVAAALSLQFLISIAYFQMYPLAALGLNLSMLVTALGFWLTEYESRMIAIGEPIPAHRLPLGVYRVINYIIFPNGDIGVFVPVDEHTKYCRLSLHEAHDRYPITWEEVKLGKLDYFEVALRGGGGKRILLIRFHQEEIKKAVETFGGTDLTADSG